MFITYPSFPRYRSLRLVKPHMVGEDVYSLQRALVSLGHELPRFGSDGDLGIETATAIPELQTEVGITADGLAGGDTQKAIALKLAAPIRVEFLLANGALRGQLEHESGFRLGNYSPQRADGSYDAGVAQRNSKLTSPAEGFDPAQSIRALGATIRAYYDLFGGVSDEHRRWQLGQGAWNAPAFACWVAREEGATVARNRCAKPSVGARTALEAYMAAVSAYLTV